jgi:hypothetical protein
MPNLRILKKSRILQGIKVCMKKIRVLNKYILKKIGFFAFVFILIHGSVFSQVIPVNQDAWVNPDHKSENLMGLKKGWFVGADFGSNLFYGAVTLYNNFPKIKDFNKSFGTGYSFYGGKKFKFGLAAEAQLFKGNIQGYKISPPLYNRRFKGDVLDYSVSVKYNLSQLFFREKQDRKFFNRLGVFATIGVGQVFYRSILYKQAYNNQWYIERTTGYNAKGIDSAGTTSAGGVVTTKSKMASAIILPVGGKINFKLNKKTDLVLDIYYVTVFSKSVDSWNRTWTKDDKYLYTGVGLCYNFGRGDEDEVPQDERLLRPHSKKEKADESSDDSDVKIPTSSGAQRKGLFNRKSNKEDKDLELKLKLYEIQLKLFEMQFMTK